MSFLSDDTETLTQKVKTMMTASALVCRTDPCDPELYPMFDFHCIYRTEDKRQEASQGCRTLGISGLDCDGILTMSI